MTPNRQKLSHTNVGRTKKLSGQLSDLESLWALAEARWPAVSRTDMDELRRCLRDLAYAILTWYNMHKGVQGAKEAWAGGLADIFIPPEDNFRLVQHEIGTIERSLFVDKLEGTVDELVEIVKNNMFVKQKAGKRKRRRLA